MWIMAWQSSIFARNMPSTVRQSGSKFVCSTGWQLMVSSTSFTICRMLRRSPVVAEMKTLGVLMGEGGCWRRMADSGAMSSLTRRS